MAEITSGRKPGGDVIGIASRLEILRVAGVALRGKAQKLTAGCAGVTSIAVHGGMRSR